MIGSSAVLDINCRCIVTVLDERGRPVAGVAVIDIRPDAQYEELLPNGAGQVEFIYGAASKFWAPNVGPHMVYIGEPGTPAGDQVVGMGLPEGHHCEYSLSFAWTPNVVTPPKRLVGRVKVLGLWFKSEFEEQK